MDWALMAKIPCKMPLASAHQLDFGQMPNLPSVLTDKPPASEGTTKSEWVAKHISALHTSRKAFTEAECSERICRALRKQIRHTDEKYEAGDKVYYKRVDCHEWKGPGVVIGQDGAVVFVRHGGTCIRVHHLRLRKVNAPNMEQHVTEDDPENDTDFEQGEETEDNNANNTEHTVSQVQQRFMQIDPAEMTTRGQNEAENLTNDIDHRTDFSLKAGQIVKYQDSGILHTAKVLGHAGKATGKYKHWYNIKYIEPTDVAETTESADMSRIEDFQVETIVPETTTPDVCEDIFVIQDVSFDTAKCKQIKIWCDKNVFEEVRDEGQKCISTRWVCTLNELPTGTVPKAQLVARSFESLWLLVAVICQRQWTINSMDIKSAFLQGMQLSRDIYIRPPPEAESKGTLWKLNTCVYGLADASQYWYNRVIEIVLTAGGKVPQVNPAVFYWLNQDCTVAGVLVCHVHDFIWGGTQSFSSTVIPQLTSAFQVRREEHGNFCYVGMDFGPGNKGVQIHQDNYIQHLRPIHMDHSRAVEQDTPLSEKENDQLRSRIGQILWVARQSRPYVTFDASNLASGLKKATVQTIHEANRIVCKLKSKKVVLNFQYLGSDDTLRMIVFSDASFGNLSDGGTQGGHLIFLMGENGKFSPLAWQSRRVKRVVRSTLAGETLAMSDGIDNAIFLSTLFSELTVGSVEHPIRKNLCHRQSFTGRRTVDYKVSH